MRDMLLKGKTRYQEFLSSEEGISTNILADRLSRLEKQGIISKRDDPENKKQILYAPTKKGLDLIPVMLELIRWGAKYDSETAAPKEFLRRLEKNPDGLKAEILSHFRKRR